MMSMPYPQVTQVEVVATQPQPADLRVLEHLNTTQANHLNNITYIVKINLSSPMPATSAGVVLSVGDYRISRYSAFPGGIYFKIHDPHFFEEHGGEAIQLSIAGMAPQPTGYQLPTSANNLPPADESITPRSANAAAEPASGELPTQEEVLHPVRN